MLFPANFDSILIARKIFTLIRCIEFFCVIFSLKKLALLPENSIFKSIFFCKNCRDKSLSQIPKEITSTHYGQKNICTCPVLLTFAIAIPFDKPLIFIENTEISSIFYAKTAEKKRSLGDLGSNIGQNSWKVFSTFAQDS